MAQLQKYRRCALGKALFTLMGRCCNRLKISAKGTEGGGWGGPRNCDLDQSNPFSPSQSLSLGQQVLASWQPSPALDGLWLLVPEDLGQAVSVMVTWHSRPILFGVICLWSVSVVICLSLSGGWNFPFYGLLCSLWPERQEHKADDVLLWKSHFAPGLSPPKCLYPSTHSKVCAQAQELFVRNSDSQSLVPSHHFRGGWAWSPHRRKPAAFRSAVMSELNSVDKGPYPAIMQSI